MGFFDKLFHGFFYVVDERTLKTYLEKELNFSLENKLEASANLNIYINNEKHHIQIMNYSDIVYEKDNENGVIIYYDNEEYKTLDDLYHSKLNNLPEYFKIELIDMDDTYLNDYKKSHPELKIENY